MNLEAIQRLRSFTVNQWSRDAGKTLKGVKLHPLSKLVREGGNLRCYYLSNTLFEVTFVGDNRVIAQMQLEGKRVATAVVHPEMLGKGVGKFMYESALQKLGKLESSDYLSVGSTASWAALCKKYRGVLVVNGKELAINGFYKKNNYTYPILYRTDGSKVKFDLALDSDSRKEAKAAENAFYRIRK